MWAHFLQTARISRRSVGMGPLVTQHRDRILTEAVPLDPEAA